MRTSATLSLALSILGALAAPVQDGPNNEKPPSGVRIRDVKWNGSGCPYKGVQSIINQEATVVTLLFANYTAQVGPNVNRGDARKNCQVSLDMQYPPGYQYSVADITMRGYIDIDSGVTVTVSSRYYFSGQGGGKDAIAKHDINGPFHNTFSKTDRVPIESLVWSPCGASAAAQINNDIRLVARDQKAGGAATVDSLDAKFTKKHSFDYNLKWRKASCKKTRLVAEDDVELGDLSVEDSIIDY